MKVCVISALVVLKITTVGTKIDFFRMKKVAVNGISIWWGNIALLVQNWPFIVTNNGWCLVDKLNYLDSEIILDETFLIEIGMAKKPPIACQNGLENEVFAKPNKLLTARKNCSLPWS